MFWRFGGYANVSTIDTLLEKPDVTLEELLDEGDLIQELKSHNTKLIEYLREDPVLEKLLEYVVAPKLEPVASEQGKGAEDFREISKCKGRERSISGSHLNAEDEEDEKEKRRSRYAYVAAEILSSDSWSLSAALFENQALLRKFWDFLKLAPPLDPLQAGYFTKVNEALLDKKTEEMLDLFKSLDNVVKNMLQHVDSPMVMDLLLKIVSLEKVEGGQGIVDWLHSQDLIPLLLSFLSAENSWATQTSAGDFLKAIIAISANASQNEQSCIGPNELTRQLVSSACVQKLINDMLKGGNPLTVGVGIVIEVIRKNNSDYDPDLGAEANTPPTNRDPIYLGTLLRLFAAHVPDFMALVLSPNHTIGGDSGLITTRRKELNAAFGSKVEPLGFDRFKTCELMAELLHCSNMGLLNEIGSEEFIRARDLERERLKVEGRFAFSTQERQVSPSEDLTMKSSMSRFGSTSPDDMRRLEVQNVSDDDGFEEVTHSGVLGDDSKDDFDEKPDLDDDLLPSTKLDTSLSFLDKDDEEFVDEPLSSPRLNSDTEHLKVNHQDIGLNVEPLSYTKTPLEKASEINIYKGVNAAPEDITYEQSISEADIDKRSLESLEGASAEFQLESEVGDAERELASKLQIPSSPEPHDYDISPHPEDKPAPLFATRQVDPFQTSQSSDEVIPVFENSGSTTDIIAEAGGRFNSVLMDNTEDYCTVNPVDEHQAEPVVGDFLKMQFVEHKVVPTILDFFFRFPWNNFLHNVVYDVVQQVFNGPMDRGYNRTLAIDLFDTGDITYRIVEGQRKSDEAQKSNKMRLGYMGHLTLIAEEVVKFTERHPSELLSDSVLEKVTNAEWNNYVEVTLAETRERDNAILGGVRPDMSVGSRQAAMNAVNAASGFGGASSALAEAGLNGSAMLDGIELFNGNGLSTTGFALTGGSLLSSFGSSSDDEDEEMEDDNDQEGSRNANSGNAEFSRYMATPSTGSIDSISSAPSADLEPPLAPPPPPPLNIPPSRARRQLAARLALHNKQNTENGSFPSGDELSLEKCGQPKVVNPFATDEDDEEHDDFTIGDLEHEAKGMGHCPPGAAPSSQPVPMDDLDLEAETPKHYVGNSSKSSMGTRAHFPLMWPFGQTQRSSYDCETNASYRGKEKERVRAKLSSIFGGHLDLSVGGNNKGANRNRANDDGTQSSDESASDDDDSDDEFGASAGIAGAKSKIHRRLSTTEATRRTSIEDDDDEGEVVHVTRRTAMGDDEDLIEIQHMGDFAHHISDGVICINTIFLEIETWSSEIIAYDSRLKETGLNSKNLEFVVKFAWRGDKRHTERELLELMKERNVWGVIKVLGSQDLETVEGLRQGLQFTQPYDFLTAAADRRVVSEGDEPATYTGSNEKYDQSLVNRTFSCITTFPLGRSISKFEFILEFLEACRDVVKALRSLYQDGKIFHRDICIKNLTIASRPDEGDAKEVLIDLDGALDLEKGPARKGVLIGSEGFMAIGILTGDPHTYQHDLESLFYVFLPADFGAAAQWTSSLCREIKTIDMNRDGFLRIPNEFSKEFEHLEGLAKGLNELLFPIRDGELFTGTDMDQDGLNRPYDGIINAFNRSIASQAHEQTF